MRQQEKSLFFRMERERERERERESERERETDYRQDAIIHFDSLQNNV